MSDQTKASTGVGSKPAGEAIWSIGIYSGDTPFNLSPCADIRNPVLSAESVTDVPAEFVADPFMIRVGGSWHMFFEVMNAQTMRGEIGWAQSEDGLGWAYRGIVLREPFHLSYPYVICADGEYYMIPESHKAGRTKLYRGDPFPDRWSSVGTIMNGGWVDSSLLFFDGLWWMFTCPAGSRSSSLELFCAESLGGRWLRHAMSPLIVENDRIARPGGRVIALGNEIIRFCQDCYPRYGTRIRAFEITQLSTSTYVEREVDSTPILAGGKEWNMDGMHHVDPHWTGDRWLACVDGFVLKEANAASEVLLRGAWSRGH